MSINKTRGALYTLAKVLGDVQAVTHKQPGKAIPKRIGRRLAGKGFAKIMRAIFPATRG